MYYPPEEVKKETGLEDHIYKYIYPMGCSSLKFYGLPNIHEANIPLRPIVFSRGSVTCGVAKVLAKILQTPGRKVPTPSPQN